MEIPILPVASRENLEGQFMVHSASFKLANTPIDKRESLAICNLILDNYNNTPARISELALRREVEIFGEISDGTQN